jgi:hypothetical protein
MKITFILKDLSDQFYNGLRSETKEFDIVGLNNLSNEEKLDYLFKTTHEGALKISSKIGSGSFRDRVEFNQMRRKEMKISYKLENRRGYKLATFEVLN